MKPILFCDFDGTICHDRFWRSLPQEKYQKVQQFLFEENQTLANEWMRGTHSAEEVNERVATHLQIPYETLWSIFVADCQTMNVPRSILDRLDVLREKYFVALITDNMDCFSRFTAPALRLDQYVDEIINSSTEGKHKIDNNGELFTSYTQTQRIPLESCILIDDSTKVCNVFEKLGGRSLLVTTEHDAQYHLENL